jgi:hypothetical protein
LLRQKKRSKRKGDFFAIAPRQKRALRCYRSSLFSLVVLVFWLCFATIGLLFKSEMDAAI